MTGPEWQQPNLRGMVAVVAGATRGAGRGIAVELGACGATVYCTGRSTRAERSPLNRPETIEDTADLVSAAGGVGLAVRTDHTREADVRALFERVREEQGGRLDVLVNDVWGGEKLVEWGKPFWELNPAQGFALLEQAVHSHILTARHGVPLMLARGSGLVLEITDGDHLDYRGNLIYDLVKTSVIRLAHNMARDFEGGSAFLKVGEPRALTALALTPGFLRSEEMLDHFGVTEANWPDAARQDPYFAESETPHYIGRAVASLAGDPNVRGKNGRALATWHLAREYGFRDVDGRQPHWQEFFERLQAQGVRSPGPS